MKCQNCGNELAQDEVFCGQCGSPNAAPVQATEMMQTPAVKSGFQGNGSRGDAQQRGPSFSQEHTSSAGRQGPQQQSGFYQEATEMIPGAPYVQQGFQSGSGMPGGYNNSGQFGTQAQQPFATGNYQQYPTYPPTQMGFANEQFGRGYGSGVTPPPEKRSNALMVVGIICLIFAIITVGAFSVLFFMKGNNQPAATPTTVVQATATATPMPSPTPSPTPSPSPSPTVAPTAAPDANFSWCGTQCTQSGYQIEYPLGWTQGATPGGPGTQFSITGAADTIYAAVKTPSSNATSASDLLTADLANFSSQTNYQGPQATLSMTIGGENWSYVTITYQLNGHTEQVNIYATIHQGKGYVIELQAGQAQFPGANAQYFDPMLKSFQFVAPAQ